MENLVDENNYPLFDGLVGLKQKPMKTAMQELIEYLEVNDRKFTYTYKKAIQLLEKEKEQIENKLGVVEIKQIISSTTGTKLTISEKHDLAVAIFEKLGGEVKSYIDEETKSDIVNKLTKKWNSGNQNK
jgi:Ethanolamine utilization protein EutJ (predicted chaperonin)